MSRRHARADRTALVQRASRRTGARPPPALMLVDIASPAAGCGGSPPRQRTTRKRSGSRGWYASAEWRARSKAHLEANPLCVVCGRKATISDHEPPVRPGDREGVLSGPIRSTCWPCHAQKSRREQGEAGKLSKVTRPSYIKGADVTGHPVDPSHPWCRERAQ